MENKDFGLFIDWKLLESGSDDCLKLCPLDKLELCVLIRYYLNYLRECSFELTDVSDLNRICRVLKRSKDFIDSLIDLSFNVD